jgi:hypothetical protein
MRFILVYLFAAFVGIVCGQELSNSKASKSVDLPASFLNIDLSGNIVGAGRANVMSGIDTKLLIGSRNSGVIIGGSMGSNKNNYFRFRSLRVGCQLRLYRGLYTNTTFSVMNLMEPKPLQKIVDQSFRFNAGLGYTISFGKEKRFYVNIESTYSLLNSRNYVGRLSLFCGLGFRLGTPASTKYEGVKNILTVPMKL